MEIEKNQERNSIPTPQYYYPPMMYPQSDEINLLDIWQTLVNRKQLIFMSCLLVSLAGGAYAFLKPDIYTYSTGIQIGSLFTNGVEKPIADPKNVASKIKELHINSVLREFYHDNPNQSRNIDIGVAIPKDSDVVFITSKSSDKAAPIYLELMAKISTNTVNELNEHIKKVKTQLTQQIAEEEMRLALLETEEKALTHRIETFDKSYKAKPVDNSGTTLLVMTELATQRHRIVTEKFNLQTLLSNQKFDLNLAKDTTILFSGSKSLEPIGISRVLVLLLAVLVGLFLGIINALIAEQIEKMKTKENNVH